MAYYLDSFGNEWHGNVQVRKNGVRLDVPSAAPKPVAASAPAPKAAPAPKPAPPTEGQVRAQLAASPGLSEIERAAIMHPAITDLKLARYMAAHPTPLQPAAPSPAQVEEERQARLRGQALDLEFGLVSSAELAAANAPACVQIFGARQVLPPARAPRTPAEEAQQRWLDEQFAAEPSGSSKAKPRGVRFDGKIQEFGV